MPYTVDIGAVPYNEDCAQLGQTQNFDTINQMEVRLYRAAIIAVHGVPPEGVTLRSKANRHDFGTYRELVAEITDAAQDDPVATEYINKVEDGVPSWLSAGFAPPIQYGSDGTADLGGRTFDEIVRGAMMTTRARDDGSFFPKNNETLHGNLRAGFPELVPDCLKDSISGCETAEQTTDASAPCVLTVLTAIAGVIDMSNPDHPTFADSAADCLDELLRHEADIRALIARAEGYRTSCKSAPASQPQEG
ncbi:hypothetical protein [Novosphingobium sp. HII-3]|uniref:hypothetical protein n=1 Tax=Novosphingobium sp. HII-3 TaxID=2075565 RepID=UPI0018EDB01B|nr:hypothetical protein [Novosphingobium sp. HII-3]